MAPASTGDTWDSWQSRDPSCIPSGPGSEDSWGYPGSEQTPFPPTQKLKKSLIKLFDVFRLYCFILEMNYENNNWLHKMV